MNEVFLGRVAIDRSYLPEFNHLGFEVVEAAVQVVEGPLDANHVLLKMIALLGELDDLLAVLGLARLFVLDELVKDLLELNGDELELLVLFLDELDSLEVGVFAFLVRLQFGVDLQVAEETGRSLLLATLDRVHACLECVGVRLQ